MTQPRSQPSPARLAERLGHLPDACRALLAAMDRAKISGGGRVLVRIEVDGIGRIRRVVVGEREYHLRSVVP